MAPAARRALIRAAIAPAAIAAAAGPAAAASPAVADDPDDAAPAPVPAGLAALAAPVGAAAAGFPRAVPLADVPWLPAGQAPDEPGEPAPPGYHPADVTRRRLLCPWYRTKTEPSVADMVTRLRREFLKARVSAIRPGHTPLDQIEDYAWTCDIPAA